jgi:hypothetical protein
MIDELREMRDQVYGRRSSDNNWDGCHKEWERDQVWLRKEYAKLPQPIPPHESLPIPKTA